MSEILLWLFAVGNTIGVVLALLGGRMALRRIRLDRSHIDELRALLFDAGQPPLAHKRKKYTLLAEQMRKSVAGAPAQPVESHSQHGEDLILWDFFGRKLQGYYLDIGAHDGVACSNTFFFECLGWTGICVEPNPDTARRCAVVRKASRVVQAACGDREATGTITFSVAEGKSWAPTRSFLETDDDNRKDLERLGLRLVEINVPYTSVDALLGPTPPMIDFVSLDVEGAELKVLQGFDFHRARPAVFVIEDNSGGRDRSVLDFLTSRGYRRVLRLGVNDFYIAANDQRHFVV
jgi:FkbM family methyltransferase